MNRRIRKLVKRSSLILALIMIIVLGYEGLQVSAVKQSSHSEMNKLDKLTIGKFRKVAPFEYNGQVRKVAYLTFDDGPTKNTTKLINVLNEKGVKGTFFIVGTNIDRYKEVVKQMADQGHYIGMHSMTHNYEQLYSKGLIVDEMIELQSRISAITGEKPVLFRSPYGSQPGLNESLRNKAVESGLKTWDWTVDSFDWKLQDNPMEIVAEIEKQLTKHVEIILLHDKPGTVEALPAIIDAIRAKGYELEGYEETHHFQMNFWNDKRM